MRRGIQALDLSEKIAPAHTAVVVVDLQNEFCADDGWFGRQGYDLEMMQAAAHRTVTLLDAARAAGTRIIFIRATYDDHFLNAPMRERSERRGLTGVRCQTGTYGVDFYLVSPQEDEPIVTKHRYSAFHGTDLEIFLDSWQIKTVLLAGVMTNVCIDSTARDAYFRGYHVVVVSDCTGTSREGRDDTTALDLHRHTLTNIELAFGVVASTDQVSATWAQVAGDLRADW
jgi:ureidoacrylate peracid hydrolase